MANQVDGRRLKPATGRRPLHPCLPVAPAEQRRLLLAAHLALAELQRGAPPAAWVDLPAAVSVAAEVIQGRQVADEVRQAVLRAGRALVDVAGLPTPTDEAKTACAAFLEVYAAILGACTWRRLIDAQRATAEAWQARSAQTSH